MREIFLESFYNDERNIFEETQKNNDQQYNEKKEETHKLLQELWAMLTKEQQEKYMEFEFAQGVEKAIIDENLYIYALKKGMAIGFEIARCFKK